MTPTDLAAWAIFGLALGAAWLSGYCYGLVKGLLRGAEQERARTDARLRDLRATLAKHYASVFHHGGGL